MTQTEPTTRDIPCPVCDKPPTAPAGASRAEPLTHCEWCGAEYPEPSDVADSDVTAPDHPAEAGR